MARIFIDGFESGDHDMWDDESNATIISSTGLDMDGDYCLDLNSTTEYLRKDITATGEMYFAFLWRCSSLTGYRDLMTLYKDSTIICGIQTYTDNKFRAIAIVSTTGSIIAVIDTTYLIEVYFKMADSGGRLVLKVDGVTDIDFTGDTKPGADTQFNKVSLGKRANDSYGYFDNFIMDNTAWIGDTKIQALVPTGVGAATGWTPSAGSNYACVDERPPNDADYVSINAVDTTDTYATGNMSGSIGSIKCVQVQSRTKYDGSPTPTNLKLVVRSGGTDYFSGDNLVPATAKSFPYLWENNPADSAAWEEADINTMEIGVRSS